jgi:hypothetical protein
MPLRHAVPPGREGGLPCVAVHSAKAFVFEPNGLFVEGLMGPPKANCAS